MSIIINVPPEQITLQFEAYKAPCQSCKFYLPDLDSDGYIRCLKASSRLSSEIILLCDRELWYKERDE